MAIQYLLVVYDKESRTVLADGEAVGVTNHMLMIPANEYEITLSGAGYAPASQMVSVLGTSVMRPRIVVFT